VVALPTATSVGVADKSSSTGQMLMPASSETLPVPDDRWQSSVSATLLVMPAVTSKAAEPEQVAAGSVVVVDSAIAKPAPAGSPPISAEILVAPETSMSPDFTNPPGPVIT